LRLSSLSEQPVMRQETRNGASMAEVLTPDICVIGGGPGGIALATAAAGYSVPVVLVEKGAMGGANLAYGGVPSAALIAAASQYEHLRRGPAMGVTGAPLQVNFPKVAEHIRSVTAAVAPTVSAERLTALGVRVVHANAHFADRRTVVAGNVVIRARRFVVATGATPAPPPVRGLEAIDYMTVESAFDLNRKPGHLIVIGATPRGIELAQAYARLGVDVTVVDEKAALAHEDPELAAIVVDRLTAEGVRIRDKTKIDGVARRRGGIRVTLADGDAAIDGSHVLVAWGRAPNIGGLGLEVAGVAHEAGGIVVDRHLRTTNRRVYAIGDVVAGPSAANRAAYQADRVLRNILYRWSHREHPSAVPLVTFTDPAIATVGLTEAQGMSRFGGVRILRFAMGENDRAQAERMPAGAIKVIVAPRGRILGAGIVGHGAAEQIAIWSLAISRGMAITDMLGFVPPYPTGATTASQLAGQFRGAGLTPGWQRRIIDIMRKFG
jgi:pyruvate/2-oxoglutarate dehydrogenase complex dihydrolipoamide dehydrogenase (E3) component